MSEVIGRLADARPASHMRPVDVNVSIVVPRRRTWHRAMVRSRAGEGGRRSQSRQTEVFEPVQERLVVLSRGRFGRLIASLISSIRRVPVLVVESKSDQE